MNRELYESVIKERDKYYWKADRLAKRNKKLKDELKEKNSGLEFYAEYSNYVFPSNNGTRLSAIDLDEGLKATEVLNKYNKAIKPSKGE